MEILMWAHKLKPKVYENSSNLNENSSTRCIGCLYKSNFQNEFYKLNCLLNNHYLLIKNWAISSLFSSMALWSKVCKQPSGPEFQQSVSAPWVTKIDAMSCWSVSRASQIGQPVKISAPRLQRASTTSVIRQWTQSCRGVSPPVSVLWLIKK